MHLIILLCLSVFSYAEEYFYIGDSHSYLNTLNVPAPNRRFGHLLIDAMNEKGSALTYYAACGSSARTWAEGGETLVADTQFSKMARSEVQSVPPSPPLEKYFQKTALSSCS